MGRAPRPAGKAALGHKWGAAAMEWVGGQSAQQDDDEGRARRNRFQDSENDRVG